MFWRKNFSFRTFLSLRVDVLDHDGEGNCLFLFRGTFLQHPTGCHDNLLREGGGVGARPSVWLSQLQSPWIDGAFAMHSRAPADLICASPSFYCGRKDWRENGAFLNKLERPGQTPLLSTVICLDNLGGKGGKNPQSRVQLAGGGISFVDKNVHYHCFCLRDSRIGGGILPIRWFGKMAPNRSCGGIDCKSRVVGE